MEVSKEALAGAFEYLRRLDERPINLERIVPMDPCCLCENIGLITFEGEGETECPLGHLPWHAART